MENSWLVLLPVAVIFVLAFTTKRAFDALLCGTVLSCILLYGKAFLPQWSSLLISTACNPDNQWILMMCGLFGSVIALLRTSNGAKGFVTIAEKYCTSRRKTLLTTFLLGVIIFIDDYLNMITVGLCMRKLYDKRKIPRQALAYLMDATGTPVCVLLPFSTWAAFYISLFLKEPGVQALGYKNGLALYLALIPFIFYAILTVLICFLFAIGKFPLLGEMKKAFKDAGNTKLETATEEDEQCAAKQPLLNRHSFRGGLHPEKLFTLDWFRVNKTNPEEGDIWDFVLPLLILIIYTLLAHDILMAILITVLFCLFWYVPRKRMTLSQWSKSVVTGFADMIPTLAILLIALMFAECCERMELSAFVIRTVGPYLTRNIFPAGVFLLVAILTFSTSSTWGVSTIVVPVILPLAVGCHANLVLTMAAILSGSTFGSHACFYSDATILASSAAEIENMSHAETQLPYAMIAAGLSVVLYLLCGFVM